MRKVQLNFLPKLNKKSSQFMKIVLITTQLISKKEQMFIYKILLEYGALFIYQTPEILCF